MAASGSSMPRRSACAKHLSRSATETSHASDPPPPRDRRFGWQQSNSGVATPPDHRGLRGPHRRSEAAPLELASWRHLDPALADRVDDHSERRHDRCLGSLLRSERQSLTECRSDLIPQGSSTSRPARRRRYRQRHQGRSACLDARGRFERPAIQRGRGWREGPSPPPSSGGWEGRLA